MGLVVPTKTVNRLAKMTESWLVGRISLVHRHQETCVPKVKRSYQSYDANCQDSYYEPEAVRDDQLLLPRLICDAVE